MSLPRFAVLLGAVSVLAALPIHAAPARAEQTNATARTALVATVSATGSTATARSGSLLATSADLTDAQPIATNGLSDSQAAFLQAAGDAARAAQGSTGVPASVTVAQAILESNWGRSTVGNAKNYFGIKATSKPGPAGVVWAATQEFLNGAMVTVQAPFRAYNSMAESFTDHAQFLVENGRYAQAFAAKNDPKEFARQIQRAGYATDPSYAQKLISLMDSYNLYQYDQPGSPLPPTALLSQAPRAQ